jgi:hypothetical protein
VNALRIFDRKMVRKMHVPNKRKEGWRKEHIRRYKIYYNG